MARKHPSHTANQNRRTRPVGPLHGLAIARTLPHVPLWEERKYEEAPGHGEGRRLVSVKPHWHPMSMHARLVAVAGGNIGLPQVDRQVKLSPRQRAKAAYTSLGEIKWPGNAPLFAEGQWSDMVAGDSETDDALLKGDGRLLVVRMMLQHNNGNNGNEDFTASTLAWDVANPDEHLAGLTTRPAGRLMVSLHTIFETLPLVPSTPAVASPAGNY